MTKLTFKLKLTEWFSVSFKLSFVKSFIPEKSNFSNELIKKELIATFLKIFTNIFKIFHLYIMTYAEINQFA